MQGEGDIYDSDNDIVGAADPSQMMGSSEEDEEGVFDEGGEGFEGDEGDEGDDNDEFQEGWGTKKKSYYGADTQDYELETDEEAAEMEEVESRRMQKESFALQDEEDFEGLSVLESIVPSTDKKKKKKKNAESDIFDLESG